MVFIKNPCYVIQRRKADILFSALRCFSPVLNIMYKRPALLQRERVLKFPNRHIYDDCSGMLVQIRGTYPERNYSRPWYPATVR